MDKKKIIIIAVIVLLIIAIVFGLVYQFVLKDKTPKEPEKIIYDESKIDDTTKELLKNELDVKIGRFGIFFNMRQGKDEPRLTVTLKNKSTEARSFTVEVAAINKETQEIIETDSLETESLKPEEEEKANMFTDINLENEDDFFNAEYKVLKVTTK